MDRRITTRSTRLWLGLAAVDALVAVMGFVAMAGGMALNCGVVFITLFSLAVALVLLVLAVTLVLAAAGFTSSRPAWTMGRVALVAIPIWFGLFLLTEC